ncbi:unnamed protein product, partial [Polarella glacialis]
VAAVTFSLSSLHVALAKRRLTLLYAWFATLQSGQPSFFHSLPLSALSSLFAWEATLRDQKLKMYDSCNSWILTLFTNGKVGPFAEVLALDSAAGCLHLTLCFFFPRFGWGCGSNRWQHRQVVEAVREFTVSGGSSVKGKVKDVAAACGPLLVCLRVFMSRPACQNKWGTGKIGDRIRVSVRDKNDWYKGEQTPKGIIARCRKEHNRKDGSYIKFDENAFVVISKNKAKGTKIKGPLSYEIQNNCRALARWIF